MMIPVGSECVPRLQRTKNNWLRVVPSSEPRSSQPKAQKTRPQGEGWRAAFSWPRRGKPRAPPSKQHQTVKCDGALHSKDGKIHQSADRVTPRTI